MLLIVHASGSLIVADLPVEQTFPLASHTLQHSRHARAIDSIAAAAMA